MRSTQRSSPISRQPISAACTFGRMPETISATVTPRHPTAWMARPGAGSTSSNSAGRPSGTRSALSSCSALMSGQKPHGSSLSPTPGVSSRIAAPAGLRPRLRPIAVSPYANRSRACSSACPTDRESAGIRASTFPTCWARSAKQRLCSPSGSRSSPCRASSAACVPSGARTSISSTSPAFSVSRAEGRIRSRTNRPRAHGTRGPAARRARPSRQGRPGGAARWPARRATPVRASPFPITNSAAISTTAGSAKPASASFTAITPVRGSATITISATASMRGRLTTNMTMAATSSTSTRARSVVVARISPWAPAAGAAHR